MSVIHMVCACGALVSAPPDPPGGRAACAACGASVVVPGSAVVGGLRGPTSPSALPPVLAAAGLPLPGPPREDPGAAPGARFESDERLDLRALEGEARALRLLGRLSVAAGLLVAAGAAVVPGVGLESRLLVAAAAVFAAVLAWAAMRGARTASLAALVLAERQRDLARGLARAGEGSEG